MLKMQYVTTSDKTDNSTPRAYVCPKMDLG